MANYYNEIDAYAAEWLRNLIKEGLIPDGEVDTRSISDVVPNDLAGFTQCHFFAGIAGWSHALRLAGWPDDRPIWTGSCPCQPFSVAGKGKGTADERHLWPVFFNLIRKCRPPVVMGEQVAGSAGYGWFDGVAADLETEGYASRAVDIPACAVNAPHIRQRLYWVAVDDAEGAGRRGGRPLDYGRRSQSGGPGTSGDMGDADDARSQGHGRPVEQHDAQGRQEPDGRSAAPGVGDMADASGARRQQVTGSASGDEEAHGRAGRHEREPHGDNVSSGYGESHWSEAIWLTGADGKSRRAQPGIRLLADGVPNRVGRLRGYGNAIVPPLAAEVIRAFMDV